MATKDPTISTVLEPCEGCDGETPHEVEIRIRTEQERGENRRFSREPYRISTCRRCGQETSLRMNNA